MSPVLSDIQSIGMSSSSTVIIIALLSSITISDSLKDSIRSQLNKGIAVTTFPSVFLISHNGEVRISPTVNVLFIF